MFTKFNQFRKAIAGRIVTFYCERAYKKAVLLADQRHNEEGETFYVIDHYEKRKLLSVINRSEFRRIKHLAQKMHRNEMFWSNYYNINMLRKQCWYHTPNRSGGNALSETDKDIRHSALIRKVLKDARLY